MPFPPDDDDDYFERNEIPTKREKRDLYEIVGGLMAEHINLKKQVDRLNKAVLFHESVPPPKHRIKQVSGISGIVIAVTAIVEIIKYVVAISGLK